MTDPTLKQGAHILRIVEEKRTPKRQLQELIRKGLLADLLDANVDEVDRNEFRRVLGLRSLGCDPNEFFRTRKGLWISGSFRDMVVVKAKPTNTIPAFRHVMIPRDMTDTEIEEKLGIGRFSETKVSALIADLISKQEGGKDGVLLNNGYTNLFYTSSCVVYVHWRTDDREWCVSTWKRDINRWFDVNRAFSPAN